MVLGTCMFEMQGLVMCLELFHQVNPNPESKQNYDVHAVSRVYFY